MSLSRYIKHKNPQIWHTEETGAEAVVDAADAPNKKEPTTYHVEESDFKQFQDSVTTPAQPIKENNAGSLETQLEQAMWQINRLAQIDKNNEQPF